MRWAVSVWLNEGDIIFDTSLVINKRMRCNDAAKDLENLFCLQMNARDFFSSSAIFRSKRSHVGVLFGKHLIVSLDCNPKPTVRMLSHTE